MESMKPVGSPPREGLENVSGAGSFQFISIQDPVDAKDPDKRRLARSHAVKQAKQRGRKRRSENLLDIANSLGPTRFLSSLFAPASAYGPFETLFEDSPELRARLSCDAARQAAEPVFSIAYPVIFQDFDSVFRSDLDDPALLNALKLTFAFAVTGGNIDQDCLDYQTKSMSIIRQRMSFPESALSLPTLGAILLLAGVEARLGMRWQVQLHMGAIRRLLEESTSRPVYLTDGIKRAIFWQDLNSSLLTGSERVVDNTTFIELSWARDPFASHFFVLAPGFQRMVHRFSSEFVEILKDIHGLQCIQDLPGYSCQNAIEMCRVDNHQASIGSRLVNLPKLSPAMEACYLAAYLCACTLCSKCWRHSVIPSHVSVHLLEKLQESEDDLLWNDCPDLLVWMLSMGGSFSPKGTARDKYIVLLRMSQAKTAGGSHDSLVGLISILSQFIWSEKAHRAQLEVFWREIWTMEMT